MRLLLSLLLAFACACSDDSGDTVVTEGDTATGNPPSTPDPAPTPPANPPPADPAATARQDLAGTWIRRCEDFQGGDEDPPNLSMRRSLNFQGSNVTYTERFFAESCEGGTDSLHSRLRARFTYRVPDYDENKVNFLNATVRRLTLSFETTEAAETANTFQICGFDDWEAGVEKNISGRDCSEILSSNFPEVGDPFFQIFRLNSSSSLQVGIVDRTEPGISPETRPTRLDPIPYSK